MVRGELALFRNKMNRRYQKDMDCHSVGNVMHVFDPFRAFLSMLKVIAYVIQEKFKMQI
jgi:hypothetical protein